MRHQLIVLDDFYTNPHEVRGGALQRDFHVSGNYPGMRTDGIAPGFSQALKTYFEENVVYRPITYWPEGYNTSYQVTTEDDTTWVHHDSTTWAAVLYLNPNPPKNTGTTIYSLKSSDVYQYEGAETEYNQKPWLADRSLWEPEIVVENRFNRLICYRGDLYHCSTTAGFGDSKENGRLFQVFFFDTEW